MGGFGVIGFESQSHLDWCRNIWAMIADGGVWAVPRSGLVFRKDEQARTWTVAERMPHDPAMPISADELRTYQDEEVGAIRQRFASIGVEVIG